MSQYLIDRIRSLPNIELHMDCEVNAIGAPRRQDLQIADP
jgi:hypothetical protein